MEAHLAKFRSLVPSLALLTHLADSGKGPVTGDALLRACAWGAYLESHAWRIYAPALSPGSGAARALARHIKAGDLGTKFAARDVQLKGWSTLSGATLIQEALRVLIALGWLRETVAPTGGRPRTRYVVSPHILMREAC